MRASRCTGLIRSGQAIARHHVRLIRSDSGASYSLNLALVTPFYAMLICFVIEVTLMLNVQIGVDYAAFAAARSAAVWLPAEVTSTSRPAQLVRMVELAAIQAITPWSSSLATPAGHSVVDDGAAIAYADAYRRLVTTGRAQSDRYTLRKWRYAASATRVEFDPPAAAIMAGRGGSPRELTVTVTYAMPFNIPLIGRMFGRATSSGTYVRDLVSTVTVEVEQPKTADGTLGIEYDSRPVSN